MGFWRKVLDRNKRLIITLISKKWLGFAVATALVWYKAITPEVWVVAFGIAVTGAVIQNTANATATTTATMTTSTPVKNPDPDPDL